MAISATPLVTNGSNVDATSFATSSISPTSNALVLAAVINRAASGSSVTPTASGNGLTWVQVATVIVSDNTNRVTIFRALGASPSAGSLTFDFGVQSQNYCYWSVSEFTGVDTSGTNGSGAVVQSNTGTDEATNTGLTISLSAFGSANNVAFGAVRAGNAINPGTGYTELGEVAGDVIFESEYKLNDANVDWTWTSSTSFAIGAALEIKAGASVGATSINSNRLMMGV